MSETNKPSAEQLAKYKQRANDMSLSEDVRAKFRAIVEKFESAVEGEPSKPAKAPRKPRATKEKAPSKTPAKRGRKPASTSEAKADNYEKAKADLKKKTGKTEEECETIIEQYRDLRAKAQTRKAKEEEASKENKKRVEKLDKKGDIIEGTNEKTADAVIETATQEVADKIEKQIEVVEQKAEKEAKAEVAKDKTLKTPQAKKEAVEKKVEQKVAEKTKTIVKRVVIDTSALLESISNTLGKFDNDSKKEFLIKLRSDIDKLLAKFAFGGITNGAVQPMNIQQSNLSSSSVNPSQFANGGGVDDISYDAVLDLLKEKLEDAVDDLPSKYTTDYYKGNEVENQSRDGFIAFTDGGYEVTWFEYLSYFSGSGYSLPTSQLDEEKDRQIEYNYTIAKERFIEEYPEIVEELGENIDYNSLYDAGYEDEAEQFSEWQTDFEDADTMMLGIGAYYYEPNNDRGIDGKHTLRLFGLVNLEAPYHRSGNLEDRYDIDITFDSIEELEQKIDEGLEAIIRWFDGDFYNDSTEKLRIRRMAKGGMTEHGLRVGDRIMGESKDLNAVFVRNNDEWHNVFLDKGTRYANGGGVDMTNQWESYLSKPDPFTGLSMMDRIEQKIQISKQAEKVWKNMSREEKYNFVHKNFTPKIGAKEQQAILNKSYGYIPMSVQKLFEKKFVKSDGVSSMLRNRRGK
jgi:chemotaxis protein histidine kinase CheA